MAYSARFSTFSRFVATDGEQGLFRILEINSGQLCAVAKDIDVLDKAFKPLRARPDSGYWHVVGGVHISRPADCNMVAHQLAQLHHIGVHDFIDAGTFFVQERLEPARSTV